MAAKYLSLVTVALLASQSVIAQTFSDCNPYKGDKCDPNPAFGDESVTLDFTQGDHSSVFDLADQTEISYDSSKGAVFTINKASEAPTMISKKYLFFGRVDVVTQAAPGAGIVSSFTLQSDNLDEIDWEWIGNDAAQAQSNYFGKGDTSTYDRGAYHPADAVTSGFHTYSIEWTAEKIDWIIDDVVVRTLHYADAQGGERFPQTPMQVRLGTWVAGKEGNSDGTIQWAGGLADFSNAPFVAYYKSLTITDYANGVDGAKEYAYKDSSGSYQSIEVATTATSDEEDEDEGDGDDNDNNATTKLTATETAPDGEDETGDGAADDKDDSATTTLITATAVTGGGEGVPSETAAVSVTPASDAAPVAAVAQAVLVAGTAWAAALVVR